MLSSLRNKFARIPKLSPYWTIASNRRTDHTPDLPDLSFKEKSLLFVYDELKTSFPKHELLFGSELCIPTITKDANYALWCKKYDRNVTAIAVKAESFDPKDIRYQPEHMPPGRIRGELHLVPTEILFNLDEQMANGVYFERKRIEVQLPYSEYRWSKVRGMWIRDEYPAYVEASSYISSEAVLYDEPRWTLKASRVFTPGPRKNNLRYISRKPYYEFTRMDLNGQ